MWHYSLYIWCMSQDSFVFVMWLIKVCDMKHSYTWRDVLMYVTWLIHICGMTHSCMWHNPSIYMTLLIDVRDMIHSYIWHGALIYVTWLIHMYDVTHWCICDDSWISATCRTRLYELLNFVNEDSLIYMIWHINACEMTHSYSWRNALLYVRWLIRKRVISYIYELCLNASGHDCENDSFIIMTWSIRIEAAFSCVPHEAQEKKRSIREYVWSSCHTYQ